ncbi:hypothetical protein [Curtobacterium sp. MCPF17_046]|uniref:hypothetical protein n=1 Tax=Curtobacterium sp. MCPF17_046 TaxID=2175663 RepID=UPI000D8846E3|nr:hypothetical protein [Curtobacterium sp. MCPF17_046]PYY43331.1 hypothetical protein DEJ32_01275 [Curtobacterium sp. MCPF17_046]
MSPESEPDAAGPSDAHGDSRARWEAVLDALEATLDGGATADEPWTEPTGLGPIPRDLVGRASRLLAAQRDRIVAVEDARRTALDHLGALRAVDATRLPSGSVYLDASA